MSELDASDGAKTIVRASVQALFFERVLLPNMRVLSRDAETEGILMSYARFLGTLNRVLLKRHSTILAKQVNIFTTNVDMVFEVAKFGVFLTIASQRPHDISETIVSQLHNYFLHRLVNNLDIHAIEKAVAYLDRVSFESLPILPTGACVLSGVSAQVPVVVQISELPREAAPNSRTISVTTKWRVPLPSPVPVQDEVIPALETTIDP